MTTKKIVFIADMFAENFQGGAELVNEELISLLIAKGHEVSKISCRFMTVNILKSLLPYPIIVGSMISMSEEVKKELSSGKYKYLFYEHDHKYLPQRNPANFVNYTAPTNTLVNVDFYKNAQAVLCQSSMHEEIINKNLNLSNTINLGSSLWGEGFLEQISQIPITKTRNAAIVASTNPVKNQKACEDFCKSKKMEYDIISADSPIQLAQKLAAYEFLVFFPTVPESLCRVAVEAKMVGCKIITNKMLGAASEPWFQSSPEDIIEEMKKAPEKTLRIVEKKLFPIEEKKEPNHFKIVIPSYNAEEWIAQCITSIKKQFYKNFECIVVNDCSTDNTQATIEKYIDGDSRFIQVNNESNCGALSNIYQSIQRLQPEDDDIIITLDGDDWLLHAHVLDLISEVYDEHQCWMTYGSYVDSHTGQRGKFSQQIPGNVIKDQSYRQSPWFSSHLRTFKHGLWKQIKEEDFLDSEGNFYPMAWDLSFMIPMLEMSSHRSHFIPDILYLYNNDNPINDHKKDNALQVKLEMEIRNKKKYLPIFSFTQTENIIDPLELLTPSRMDVTAKYLYAKHRELGVEEVWAKDLYLEHLRVWNGFNESLDDSKNCAEDFILSFNQLLDNIKKDGYDGEISRVPLLNNQHLLNGSHRLASCILHNQPIAWRPGTPEEGQVSCSYEYFRTKTDIVSTGLSSQWTDPMLIEYIRQKKNTRIITIFPSVWKYLPDHLGNPNPKSILDILDKKVNIITGGMLDLTDQGSLNLIANLYQGEKWLGTSEQNFPGVYDKRNRCFNHTGPILVLAIDNEKNEDLISLKEEVRNLFPLEKHSIHINDEHEETERLVKMLFNPNSLYHLNYSPLQKPPKFAKLFKQYKKWAQKQADPENYCVGGSAVLSSFGLRDCQDLDYLCHGEAQPSSIEDISCHNNEISKYAHSKNEILYNPSNYFYIDGLKFASLNIIDALKQKRSEPKDVKDSKLIKKILPPLEAFAS